MKVYGIETEWVSEKHGLLKPNNSRSNAGVIPAILRTMGNGKYADLMKDKVVNEDIENKIKESFPDGYDNVILLLVDGVGVERLEAIGGPLWDNINSQGTIANSVFPTMTTTNMTSLSFGTLPSDHGFVGYNIYNEKIDTIFNGLNGKYMKDGEEKLIHDDFAASDFVEGTSIPKMILDLEDVKLTFLKPVQQGDEGLITLIADEVPMTDYETPMELGMKLLGQLNADIAEQFIAVYIGYADYFGHSHGPKSEEYVGAIKGVEQALGLLLSQQKIINGRTLIVLTSDHGQSQINHDISKWMERLEWEQYTKAGFELSTSGRTIHLFCKNNDLRGGRELLEAIGGENGHVITGREALALLGDDKGDWKDRIGDFVLLYEDGFIHDIPESVKFGDYEGKLLGQHGSLTKEELYVPVGIWGGKK